MAEKRVTKKAIVASLLSVAVCTTMLVGTSYAWFTDSASSNGNIIKTGTLNIDLMKGTKNAATGDIDYVSVKQNGDKIFNYEKWEPGYTEWANVKVTTNGSLALKYTLNFVSDGNIVGAELANVIDVYYSPSEIKKPDARPDDLSQVHGLRKLGTLADVFAGGAQYEIKDYLIPEAAAKNAADVNTEDFATIVFKMQEEAGNAYQNKTIPAFDLAVVATQYTYEDDTFNDQYDKNAQFPIVANTRAEFLNALDEVEDGGTIKLGTNMSNWTPINNGKKFTIDMDGHKVESAGGWGITVEDGDVTITNGTIETTYCGLDMEPTTPDTVAKLTVAKDVTINAPYGMIVWAAKGDAVVDGTSVVDLYGKVEGGLFVTGNMKGGDSVVNVYGEITGLDNGTDNCNPLGIALNGHATVNVYDGAKITGKTGLEVRAGNLNVYGGTITGTDTNVTVTPNGSGTTTTGAGVAVSPHTTQLPINVNISGGTISGKAPLLLANPQNAPADKLAQVKVDVTGGTFTVTNDGTNKFVKNDESCNNMIYTNVYDN